MSALFYFDVTTSAGEKVGVTASWFEITDRGAEFVVSDGGKEQLVGFYPHPVGVRRMNSVPPTGGVA